MININRGEESRHIIVLFMFESFGTKYLEHLSRTDRCESSFQLLIIYLQLDKGVH